jgi:TP901 family phage tail tape measure protein
VGSLGKAVAVSGAAIGAAAAVIGAESVKMAVNFQASMEKIHTQAGASQAAVESLTKSVLQLAPSTQQGPEQLSEALYHLKSVGMDNADAMKALKTASDLAAVGGANLEDTTNALAGAWRSGIRGATDFGGAASTVNAIIGAGNMKMEDFVQAIGTGILPSAKTFGLSLSQVGSALALMTDEGVPAVDAATRLRMSFSLLGAPSAAANKVLGQIGLTGLQLANAMRGPQGLIGAISLLKDHLDASGMSASKQAQIISAAFGGGRSSSAIMTMLNNLDVLEKKQQQINDTTGRYGGAVAAQRQTAQAQFAILRSSIDTLGIRLGLDLLPPVTAFVKYLAATAVPAVAKFAHAVMSIIPVGTIKRDFDQVETWIDNLFGIKQKPKPVKVPVQLGPVVGGTKASIFNAPVTVPTKLGPVVGGTSSLYNLPAATVQARLGPEIGGQSAQIFNALPGHAAKAGGGIADSIISAVKKVDWGQVFSDILSSAVSGAQKIGAAFVDLLGKINWTQVGGAAAKVMVGLIVGIFNGLLPAILDEAIHHPLDMLQFILALIPIGKAAGILIDVLDKVPIIGPLTKFFLGPVAKVGDMLWSLLKKILGKVFGPVGDLIGGYFKDALSWLRGKGESILLGLWYGAEDAWGAVVRWLGKFGNFVLAPFKAAGKWLLKVGGDIIGGLWEGEKARWSDAWSWVTKIGGWIGGVFAKAGSWLLAHGRDIIDGLWSGEKDRWSTAWSWVTKIGGWIISAFAKAASWLVGHGRDIISGLWNGQKAQWSAAWSWITKIGGWIIGSFAKAGGWLVGHGGDIIRGLKNGMVNAMKDIGGWVKSNVVDPVINWVKHFFGIKSPSTVMAGIGGHLMSGLFQGMMGGDLTGMVKQIFGSLPDALGSIVEKGLASVASLPSKALSALTGLGSKLGNFIGGLFSGGGGGGNASNEAIGKAMAAAMGWTGSQWTALQSLWTRESGWNTTATNPSSGAYGIPQSLPASKMASAGADYMTNPATQIRWGLGYILGRYGSPAAAWAHETSAGWYASGGKVPGTGNSDSVLAMLTPGEAVIPKHLVPLFADALKAHGVPGFASGGVVGGRLTAEQSRGLTVADTYMSGVVTTLSKIASEQSAAVKAIQTYYSGHSAASREREISTQSRQLTNLANKLTTLTSQHNAAVSYQSSVQSNLSGYGALSGLTVDPFQKGGGLSSQLQAKLAQLNKFSGAIGQLKKAGLSKTLLQQVVAMGPDDGYTYAQAMLSGGSSIIKQINTAEGAITSAAGGVAHTAAVAVYGKAVVDGFKAQQSALEKQMKNLGATMGREVARWLGVPASKLPHYGHGGTFSAGQLFVVGDRGPELASFGQSGRVYSPEQSAALTARGGDGGALHVENVNINHVPGFTTVKDIENGLTAAARQVRLARR